MIQIQVVSVVFSAAHLYHQKKWSEAENRAVFGKCFTEHGHGHNYRLEVAFQNSRSPLAELQDRVDQARNLLEHRHLNFDLEEFKDTIPTTENIALFLLKKLQELCPKEFICSIKLFEMDDLWVEIRV
jgi:6-pyruvoyltetrahydropterin/6-carboxytetrahydropterin synthase